MIFDISFKTEAKSEEGRRIQDLCGLLHENGWIVKGTFNFKEERGEPQTLADLYLYARGLYGDPSVRFDVLHKEVTERFMKLMKTDVPLCPKLTALYDGAKASYDDPTIAFDQLHTFVCQNFVDIMSQEAD